MMRQALMGTVAVLSGLALVSCSPSNKAEDVHQTVERVLVHPAKMTTSDGHQFTLELIHPTLTGEYPLVLFSSGAFGSPDRYRKLLMPIAEAGYVIAAPIHRDAEVLALDPQPGPQEVWQTRNSEIAYLATAQDQIERLLEGTDISLAEGDLAVMGHSYGALIAQLGAGAIATEPDGSQPDGTLPELDALVAFSPPGPIADRIDSEGWASIAVPSLTVTGTEDTLPGFIDDWRLHLVGHEATPEGARWLWIGDDVDHYFGGSFGREKPVEPEIEMLFNHAVATTIAFLDLHLNDAPPPTSPPPTGVTLEKDRP